MLRREWDRFVNRCVWSWAGWRHCWQTEPSLKFWTVINVVSATGALALPLTTAERALMLALGILVLAAELMNTGVERAIDHISKDEHPLARQAKDAASAGVALTAIAGGVAWVVILLRLLV